MTSLKGDFEISAKNDGRGTQLVVKATLRSREEANAFVEAFNPLQQALFPDFRSEDACADDAPAPNAEPHAAPETEPASEETATLAREPLPGTKAGDVLAALRAGEFDHREPTKRLGMTRYEARIVYERLVANGWWTPANEGEAA